MARAAEERAQAAAAQAPGPDGNLGSLRRDQRKAGLGQGARRHQDSHPGVWEENDTQTPG